MSLAASCPVATVAVIVKDRRELMGRCLDGLFAQDLGVGWELVVVDNGSTDGTAEMVEERAGQSPAPVTVVREPGSVGRARNAALSAARGPIIAFVDSDCVPRADWLRAGLAALDEPGGESVGVVQGCTLPDPDVPRRRWAATQELTSFTWRYEACNIFYRVDALRSAGGFDEEIGFFGEDTAAGWAVHRAGWDPAFTPDAVVHHAVTHPGLAWFLRRALRYGNWNALVRRFPEIRDELLWHRWFLRPASASFAALVAGIVLGAVFRPALVLCVPWVWVRRPREWSIGAVANVPRMAAFDAAVFCGLARGSLREKTVVL